MKKTLNIIILVLLVLSIFVGCGKSDEPKDKGNTEATTKIDFEEVFACTSKQKFSGLTSEQQNAIVEAGKQAGVAVMFTDADLDVVFFTREADNYHATYTAGDWNCYFPKDAEWPDDEFTQQVPKIDYPLFSAYTRPENGFSAIVKDLTMDQAKEYTEKVKKAGFTADAVVEDTEFAFKYSARNKKGYLVEIKFYISSTRNTLYLDVTK